MAAIEQATDPSLEAGPVTPRDDILTALGKPGMQSVNLMACLVALALGITDDRYNCSNT